MTQPTDAPPTPSLLGDDWTDVSGVERRLGIDLPAEMRPGVAANLQLLLHHWSVLRRAPPA